MYWPNGVPRVYAVNGPEIPRDLPYDDSDTYDSPQEQSELVNKDGSASNDEPKPSSSSPKDEHGQRAQEAISGLCVSRSGHMFATMTESFVAIWQTRVWWLSCLDWIGSRLCID